MAITISGGMVIGSMLFTPPPAEVVVTDPYFNYVTTLLSPTTPTTTFITDASTNNSTVTQAGDTMPNYFSPYGTAGYYGAYFDGSSAGLQAPSNAAFNLAGTSWTAECWLNPSGDYSNYRTVFTKRVSGTATTSYQGYLKISTGVLSFFNGTQYNSSYTLTPNVWSHCAWVYDGTNLSIYVNGTSVYTVSVSMGADNGEVFKIGGVNGIGEVYHGYISNFRLVKGTALYTSTFTPPTSPLTAISGTSLLTLQDNRLIDNSTNAFALTNSGAASVQVNYSNPFSPTAPTTNGSGYFDGSGDYLTSPQISFGTGDFTVECWTYLTSRAATYPCVFSNYNSYTTGSLGLFAGHNSASTSLYQVALNGGSFPAIQSTTSIVYNTWVHLAVVRSSGVITLYVNGVANGTASFASSLPGVGSAWYTGIAGDAASQSYINGYIADFRVVTGTAVYTTAFTPPAAPLTAISGTSLLTLQNNQPVNNSMFQDSTNFSWPITRYGNTSQGARTPYSSSWSNYFDGTGDYLTMSYSTSLFDWWTSDYTLECWVYPTTFTGWYYMDGAAVKGTIVGNNEYNTTTNYWSLGLNSSGNVYFDYYNGASQGGAGSQTANLNAWNHVAMVKSGSNITVYLNGVGTSLGSVSGTPLSSSSIPLTIGAGNGSYINGYLSNLRIVKGTAVYTTTFTPPTSPLTAVSGTSLLTCQSNRFVDNSTNALTITRNGDTSVEKFSPFANASAWTGTGSGGSTYFDGSGDYLRLPSSAMALSNGDWTVEMWVYLKAMPTSNDWPSSWSSTMTLCSVGTPSGGDGFNCLLGSTQMFVQSNDTKYGTATHGLTTSQWAHLAYVRSGNTIYFYVNGVQKGSVAFSGSAGTGSYTYIGTETGEGAYFNGYMADLRVVKGTAIYTTTFTPPTAPLSAVANTWLLPTVTPTPADYSMINDFESAGDAKIVTNTIKYGYNSMYFDGSGDYLKFPDSPALEPGSGSFTWEMWINTTSSTQYATIYSRTPSSFSSGMWAFMMNMASATSGDVGIFVGDYSTGSPLLQTTGVSVRDGAWHHIALVRNGSAWALYVDGTSRATATWSGTIANLSTGPLIAADQNYARYYAGYISDFRVTNGIARYTTDFTPPTTTFPTS